MAAKKKSTSPGNRTNRTPIKKAQALEGYVEKGTVTAACKRAKIGRQTWYDWVKADPEFAKAADNAYEQVTDSIEETAIEKARAGDTTLCIFLTKNRRKEVYGDKQEISGPGGGPVELGVGFFEGLKAAKGLLDPGVDDSGKGADESVDTGEPQANS